MKNGLFQLYKNDWIKGLITAVFSAVIVSLYAITVDGDFSFFNVDWTVTGKKIVDVAGITFISYMAKNYLSDSKGNVLGVTGGNK